MTTVHDDPTTTGPRLGDAIRIHLVIHLDAPWSARTLLAAALTTRLGEHGIDGHAAPATHGVAITVNPRRTGDDRVPAALGAWAADLSTLRIPAPVPPASPAELVTELTFADLGAGSDAEAHRQRDDRELAEQMLASPFDVVVTGTPADSTDLYDAVAQALSSSFPAHRSARPARIRPAPSARTVDPGHRWARVPIDTALVRHHKPITAPRDGRHQCARALANIAFGGVYRSLLVDVVRRRRTLSYSPSSTLVRRDDIHAVVIDIPCLRGRESDGVDAVRDSLTEFGRIGCSSTTIDAAARFLIGRTVIDRDTPSGAAAEQVALLDDPEMYRIAPGLRPDELVADIGLDTIETAAAELFDGSGWSVLVLSGDPAPTPRHPQESIDNHWEAL